MKENYLKNYCLQKLKLIAKMYDVINLQYLFKELAAH